MLQRKKNVLLLVLALLAVVMLVLVVVMIKRYDAYDSLEVLANGLDTPWAMDFLPSGELIFTERPGRVNVLENGLVRTVGEVSVSEESESGLMGLAVDPEFSDNHYLYLYYTYPEGNRLSRFTLDKGLRDELVLIDNIPNARFHDGGRLKFGHDGKLYLTTGDATVPSSAQDLTSLSGKILRLNKDGTIPDDNPFNNYVYSYGHRNPQGLAWDYAGDLYASEHGPSANDEINLIKPGRNYGWPLKCSEQDSSTESPLRCYAEFTLAPAGIAYDRGRLFVAGLRGSQVRELSLYNSSVISEGEVFSDLGRIRDVVVHEGYLYIATSNRDGRGIPSLGDDRILRIRL